MSKHLFGLVCTHHGTAANNRGENEGNITTLQKIIWKGEVHTTVSAEAIRWAIRYYWQCKGIPVNRVWDEEKADHKWIDSRWTAWTDPEKADDIGFIDDDVMGFMLAEAGKDEGNTAETETEQESGKKKTGKKAKVKGTCDKRRGALEVTRALSLIPFTGDITFNAKSGEKGSTSLYGTEVHATRYQYGFALTPEHLRLPSRAEDVINAVLHLAEVAGNHARFLYDFSPESIILRWTDDFAPRILYGFAFNEKGELDIPDVVSRIRAGDIDPEQIIIGGPVINHPHIQSLNDKITLCAGIKEAGEKLIKRLKVDLQF